MRKRFLGLFVAIFGLALSVCAQGTIDKYGVYHPTEEEVAANKRLTELLRHPSYVTLRLVAIPHDRSREPPSDAPPPYTVGDWIDFQLLITQSLSEVLILATHGWSYYDCRPELYRSGEILPYSKTAQERLEKAEKMGPSGSAITVRLVPSRERLWTDINMDDWYEPLLPGHYQLSVRKRFVSDGDWAQSNPVIFDVQPRRPAALVPSTVKVKVVPSGFEGKPEQKLYRVSSDVRVTVIVVNDSDRRIRVDVIDLYYGNRPQLFKDGKLLPYREETATLVHSKDENPRLVDVSSDLSLGPHTASGLQELNLNGWYGPLAPGLYRLINRRRLEIDGPWTADSVELLFEVVRQ